MCQNLTQEMRVKQLTPVDHLPTIFESHDEVYHDTLCTKDAGLSSGCHPPQTQDDYLKSICQLAEPTFLFGTSSKTQNSSYVNTLLSTPKQTISHRHNADPPSPISLQRSSRKGNRLCMLADAFSVDTITTAVSSSETLGKSSDSFSRLFSRSHNENHRRSNQQFPQRHFLALYAQEAKCSRKTHWLSLDHMIMEESCLHGKQPSREDVKASSTGCSANIMQGKLASSELFSYHW
ncbi:uncharacterized protein LOC109938333 [Rhincodon typus]|uniref:uncharacterized protein LOC109938333 n=1 Tax=Rhincodon typus TaxID=259920 RepID=UPI002030CAB4|nr:uncharacterized protein LOC109938333 [Rhincodon typus]